MLVLSRKSGESVVVGEPGNRLEQVLKITVLEIGNGRVELGFEAPGDVPINRLEVWRRIRSGIRTIQPAMNDGDIAYQC